MTPSKERKEKQDVLESLRCAYLISAKKGGTGYGLHFTDYQLGYLLLLVKEDLYEK